MAITRARGARESESAAPLPRAPAEGRPARTAAALLIALLLGVGAALAAMPALFRLAPTDLSRLDVLLAAERSGEPAAILVLGNSIAMCGVDGRQLTRELPGAPVALNFASTGQTLAESYLLLQDLPKGVETLVLVLPPDALFGPESLSSQKYNAFYMFGFRPDAETRQTLDTLFGRSMRDVLGASGIAQRFRARWALRELVDGAARRLLRKDLALDRATTDLQFPQPYRERLAPEKMRRAVEQQIAISARLRDEPDPAKAKLLGQIAARATAGERRLLVVLPPANPGVRAALGGELPEPFAGALARLREHPRAALLDLRKLLGEEEFIDAVHPTSEGARRITGAVAEALRNPA